MSMKIRPRSKISIGIMLTAAAFFFFLNDLPLSAADECPVMDDIPLDVQIESSPPNIMFIIDDSGSMDWEFSTKFYDGQFHAYSDDDEVAYLYDSPESFYNGGDLGSILGVDRGDRAQWRATWSGFNRMYYKPQNQDGDPMEYNPWKKPDGSGRFPDADMNTPKLHPTVFLVESGDVVDGDEDGVNNVDHARNAFSLNGIWKVFESPDSSSNEIVVNDEDAGDIATAGIVLDDQDNSYSEDNDNNWNDSTNSVMKYADNARFTNDLNEIATWEHRFGNAEADDTGTPYTVKIWFSCHPEDKWDSQAQVTVTADNLTIPFTTTVDQNANCGQWYTLGTFDYVKNYTGSVTVKRVSTASPYTAADAVLFIKPENIQTSPYIEAGGDWDDSTNSTSPYGTNTRYTDTLNATATWTHEFTAAEAGTNYAVQVWSACHNSGEFDTQAQHTVTDASGTPVSFTVDQNATCGDWHTLDDDFSFNDGTIGTVQVKRVSDVNEYTAADAVRFIPAAGITEDITIINAHYYTEGADNKLYLVNLTDPVEYYEVNVTVPAVDANGDPIYDSCDDATKQQLTGLESYTGSGKIYDQQDGCIVHDAKPPLLTYSDFTKLDDPPDDIEVDYATARQNFANWFTYYRRRALTAIAAVSEVVSTLDNVYLGLAGINSVQESFPEGVGMIEPLLPVGMGVDVDENDLKGDGDKTARQYIMESIQAFDQVGSYDSTPTKDAVAEVGQYFTRSASMGNEAARGQGRQDKWRCGVLTESEVTGHGYPAYFTTDNCEPLNGDKAACQQNFVLFFTDGYYNGSGTNYSDYDDDVDVWIVEDADGNQFPTKNPADTVKKLYQISGTAPYEDSPGNTLADIAMYYYAQDLADDIENIVPTSFPDVASHQHIVTYTIAFGVEGHLDPDDYTLYGENPVYPTWPTQFTGQNYPSKIDDMWHTAVNGRGEFYSASDPEELIKAFEEAVTSIMERLGTGASASVNTTQDLTAGSQLYLSGYNSDRWAGLVVAWNLNEDTGYLVDLAWNAADKLEARINDANRGHSNRLIATYDSATGTGTAFSGDLTEFHPDLTESVVNYIRGDKSNEEQNSGTFRSRLTSWPTADPLVEPVETSYTLGDIIHSSPFYHDDMLYAGANDGMLHAFRTTESTIGAGDEGEELFAYVPALLHSDLSALTDPDYSHQYYVDLTPTVRSKVDINKTPNNGDDDITMLVGGLGKGGKGYFALNVTNAKTFASASDVAAKVLWEFDGGSFYASDMGYSFSRPVISKTYSSTYPWVVIFGNGYGSTNGESGIFVLDAKSGAVIHYFDTNVAGSDTCNGMSSPFPADINNDGYIDYIYAGDLKGNMWKINMRKTDHTQWGFAFKNAGNPQPLFTAKDTAGNPQPITGRPDATGHCSGIGQMVIFGTGKYLGTPDISDDSPQTLYGVWDYGEAGDPDSSTDASAPTGDTSEYVGSFDRPNISKWSGDPITLLEQTVLSTVTPDDTTMRIFSDNSPDWTTKEDLTAPSNEEDPDPDLANAGWFFDLPDPNERITERIIIRSGKAIVVSNVPGTEASVCTAGSGYSYLMSVDVCTGGRVDSPVFDLNGDGVIDDNDMVTVTVGGETIQVPPTGLKVDHLIYAPAVISQGEKDLLYNPELTPEMASGEGDVSGNNPNIASGADVGMTFWLQHME